MSCAVVCSVKQFKNGRTSKNKLKTSLVVRSYHDWKNVSYLLGNKYLDSAVPTKSNITDFIFRHIQYLTYSTTTSVMFKIINYNNDKTASMN